MIQEDKDIIVENLLKLFNILNDKTSIIFIRKIESVFGKSNKSIGDLIKSATDIQLAELMKCAANLKYKENPKPYFDKIVKVFKDNLSQK